MHRALGVELRRALLVLPIRVRLRIVNGRLVIAWIIGGHGTFWSTATAAATIAAQRSTRAATQTRMCGTIDEVTQEEIVEQLVDFFDRWHWCDDFAVRTGDHLVTLARRVDAVVAQRVATTDDLGHTLIEIEGLPAEGALLLLVDVQRSALHRFGDHRWCGRLFRRGFHFRHWSLASILREFDSWNLICRHRRRCASCRRSPEFEFSRCSSRTTLTRFPSRFWAPT